MKILSTVSACALIALAVPAFAQSNTGVNGNGMQQNGSPNGAGMSREKQPGAADTQSGGMTEGRSSATDPNNSAGAMKNGGTGTGVGTQNGNMAPGGGPGESGGGAK